MYKFLFFALITLSVFDLNAQKKSASPVLLTIDDKQYTYDEFMYVFNKNNNQAATDSRDKSEYLDLYINFRLKVKEAEDRGMDTTFAFKKELKGYRDQLAQPYLVDKSVDDVILKEAYDRLQWDLRASHIMIALPEETSKNDSNAVAAYNKLMDIRKQILGGADFAEMAKKHSEDPSARDMAAVRNQPARKGNGGDLGYFSAFYMVYPFETAAYNTPVGEVSMPIRTQYGYHIIKVTDRIAELGKIEVKHINVKTKSTSQQDIEAAKTKIEEIALKIKNGEMSFENAARNYSDDKGSAEKDGLLPAFEVSRMVPEFVKAISKLKTDSISQPVLTEYGWHLIKLVSITKTPPYDEYVYTLKSRVARDSRSNMSKESAIQKYKKTYKFKEYPKALNSYYAFVDSSLYKGTWSSEKAAQSQVVMFEANKVKHTQGEFAQYMQSHQVSKKKGTLRYFTDLLYQSWVAETLVYIKDQNLENENPEFKMLVQEYHDGILLFAINDEEVWSKSVRDTVGLKAFYDKNIQNYQWKDRVDATIYKCKTEDLASKITGWLKAGIALDSIVKLSNATSPLNMAFIKGKFQPEENDIIDQVKHEVGISNVIYFDQLYNVVYIHQILPAQPKTLDDARGIITADYQNYLENLWIEQLKQKHKVEVNTSLLNP